jgi:uncharacterized protein YjbI with pentapeptide repeats
VFAVWAVNRWRVDKNHPVIWWIAGGAAFLIAALALKRRVQSWVKDHYGKVQSWVTDRYRRVRRWARHPLRGLSLLLTVFIAVGGGVAIAAVATWILEKRIHTNSALAAPIDITKLSFTVAGGVGAAVALVVAYRRQRDIEQGRFVERFGAAAAQLGDHDVAVRIAGVYAMAGVADESTRLRRQQCIDVLCGYLRLPYSPDLGSNHQSKLVVTEPRTCDDGSPLGQQERHLEYRQNDKEVRATIVRVIADHLRDHEYDWSACDFDFRTAQLEDVDLSHARFDGITRFDAATFSGEARFSEATFSGQARFSEATFSGQARFDKARFSDVWFVKATFSGAADFHDSRFSGAAVFASASFSGAADFRDSRFSGAAQFDKATFSGAARFYKARFSSTARFDTATFSGEARFDAATFSGYTVFGGSWFSGEARFDKATFSGAAVFASASFSGQARFDAASFSFSAQFDKARFSDEARFVKATFSGAAVFASASFSGAADFRDSRFSGAAQFGGASFSGPARFARTDFGREAIAFENPRQWGPPAPKFDWDDDLSTKPENVTPQNWPPTPIGTGVASG